MGDVVERAVHALARLEAHWTVSREEYSVAAKIFVADIFNTAFVMLIVYGLISGYPSGLWRIPFLFNGQLPDFTKPWYSSVGSTLCQTMALKALVAHLKKLGVYYGGRAWARLARGGAVTQEQLNEMHARPPFRLAERYGEARRRAGARVSSLPPLTHAYPPCSPTPYPPPTHPTRSTRSSSSPSSSPRACPSSSGSSSPTVWRALPLPSIRLTPPSLPLRCIRRSVQVLTRTIHPRAPTHRSGTSSTRCTS